MSGLVLLFPGRPLKPAPKISGENRRRFYLSRYAGVSETQVERESAGEILSERSESKDLLYPFCGRERDAVELESAGEVPRFARDLFSGICHDSGLWRRSQRLSAFTTVSYCLRRLGNHSGIGTVLRSGSRSLAQRTQITIAAHSCFSLNTWARTPTRSSGRSTVSIQL